MAKFQKISKLIKQPWKDSISGGEADKAKPEQFNLSQLSSGSQEEKEHTEDLKKAMEIAMDHLIQDPNYYKKLKKID